jgi:hypothetical protein
MAGLGLGLGWDKTVVGLDELVRRILYQYIALAILRHRQFW